jgi:hypothetical protein
LSLWVSNAAILEVGRAQAEVLGWRWMLPDSAGGLSSRMSEEFNDDMIHRSDLPEDVFGLLHDLCYHHDGRDVSDYVSRAREILRRHDRHLKVPHREFRVLREIELLPLRETAIVGARRVPRIRVFILKRSLTQAAVKSGPSNFTITSNRPHTDIRRNNLRDTLRGSRSQDTGVHRCGALHSAFVSRSAAGSCCGPYETPVYWLAATGKRCRPRSCAYLRR